MRRFLARAIRAARLLARDGRIPRPLRALVAVALLPIPGPFDEAVFLVAAVPLFVVYREPMRDAWRRAEAGGVSARASPMGGPGPRA